MNFESIKPINIRKAYIIHFRYKSTEELINKIKRGYSNWFKDNLENFLKGNLRFYFTINNPTPEKIKLIEKELNMDISDVINNINKKQIYIQKLKKFFGFLF